MSPCTGSRANTNYEQIASWGGYQCLTGDPRIYPSPPTVVASILTTRPWPLRQKRIGTSWAVSPIGYTSESILGRDDSPLDCLHLALAFRYIFLWRKHLIPKCFNCSPGNKLILIPVFNCQCAPSDQQEPGFWLNIKMSSYQHRKSHCGDKTILRPSYLHNMISYIGNMTPYIESGPRSIWRMWRHVTRGSAGELRRLFYG